MGYSGSDLKEVCRAAAWEPVREMTSGASRKAVGWESGGTNNNSKGGGGSSSSSSTAAALKRTSSGFPPRGTKARAVNKNDFLLAVQKVKKTGESARDFQKREMLRGRDERLAMAEDIRNTPVDDGTRNNSSSNAKRASSSMPQSSSQPMPMQQIDIQELMKVAMVAAASMNNQGYRDDDGRGAVDTGDEEDDDSPPEIFVDATS